MRRRASHAAAGVRPTPPVDDGTGLAPVPTEAEARARLAGFKSTVGRLTQAEFDALVAAAARAEDEEDGR